MKALFFVEAPFQLLSAYEAVASYCISEYKIYIRLSNSSNNDIQLKKLAEILFENDSNVNYILISTQNRSFLDYLNVSYYCITTFFMQVKYDYIFIGNYESRFLFLLLKPIQKNKLVILDDGVKSINFQNSFSDSYNFNLFTMLKNLKPFKNQIIIYNYFIRFNQFNKDNHINFEDKILFIGSKLSEVNIISDEYYIRLLKKISKHYKNNQIIYIPHRGESKSKLDLISIALDNIIIKELDYPVEFYPLYEKFMPRKVVSFYSAALITISQLYTNVEVISFHFDYSKAEYKYKIDEVYNYLRNYIKVIK